ncbi:hypothetical protein [Flavobacterium sp. LAR06]|uniref:hypothetical protein n=1 Tax=Flavobacterium sp. LAR06 TaxID=3064897 RepID=UPI0035C0737F
MELRFTKYAFINALWTLIPVFPIFSLFPAVFLAMGIEKLVNNCEMSYIIVLCLSIILILLIGILFIRKTDSLLLNDEKTIKEKFMLLNFILYFLIHTAVFILLAGVNIACHGDGQTPLLCIISGPISSLLLIVFGFSIDLK